MTGRANPAEAPGEAGVAGRGHLGALSGDSLSRRGAAGAEANCPGAQRERCVHRCAQALVTQGGALPLAHERRCRCRCRTAATSSLLRFWAGFVRAARNLTAGGARSSLVGTGTRRKVRTLRWLPAAPLPWEDPVSRYQIAATRGHAAEPLRPGWRAPSPGKGLKEDKAGALQRPDGGEENPLSCNWIRWWQR